MISDNNIKNASPISKITGTNFNKQVVIIMNVRF